MKTELINQLSDYFADVVLCKMQSKSTWQLLSARVRIKNFDDAVRNWLSLSDEVEIGREVDISLLSCAESERKARLEFVAEDWSSDENNMKCVYAQLVQNTELPSWFLAYQIQIHELLMFFTCQVDTEEVFNYQLEVKAGDPEKYSDYFLGQSISSFE
jgi:hypothetical protein